MSRNGSTVGDIKISQTSNHKVLSIHQVKTSENGATNDKKIMLTDGNEFVIRHRVEDERPKQFIGSTYENMTDYQDDMEQSNNTPIFVSMALNKDDSKLVEKRRLTSANSQENCVCAVCRIF